MELTASMSRLCKEIAASREARGSFLENLAKETREMLAKFTFGHSQMARKMKADLRAFMHSFRQKVAEQREEVRGELAAAHRAWFGPALVSEQRRTAEAPRKPHKK